MKTIQKLLNCSLSTRGFWAIGLALLAGFVQAKAAGVETPPYTAAIPTANSRFDEVYYIQPHNSYENGSSLRGWLDAGFRSVEIDVIDKGDWENETKGPLVSHDGSGGQENCSSGASNDRLGHCLQDLMDWVDDNPGAEPLLVLVDMKASWDPGNAWKSDEVALLDEWIANYMDDKLYAYSDLYDALLTQGGGFPRELLAQHGWPRMSALEGRIIIALTGGKIGAVNQNMNGGLVDLYFNYGRFPVTFMCPDVESDPEELDVGGTIDGISNNNSQFFVCSNLRSRDHYQVTANRAAQNKQLIHLWRSRSRLWQHVYGSTSYTYNYIAVAHGIQAIGQDLSRPSSGTTWGGSIPYVGVRRSLPGYFKLRPVSDTSLCLDVQRASYGNGSDLQSWPCHTGANQRFVYTAEGQLRPRGNNKYCVDIDGGDAGNLEKMHLWNCDGGASEKWEINANGQFRSRENGNFCMEAGYPTGQGVQWQTYSCGPWTEQRFWLDPVADWHQTSF